MRLGRRGQCCPGVTGYAFAARSQASTSCWPAPRPASTISWSASLGDHGELRHAIPQRYVMSTEGLLSYGFDGLEAEEREESSRIEELDMPTPERRSNNANIHCLGHWISPENSRQDP